MLRNDIAIDTPNCSLLAVFWKPSTIPPPRLCRLAFHQGHFLLKCLSHESSLARLFEGPWYCSVADSSPGWATSALRTKVYSTKKFDPKFRQDDSLPRLQFFLSFVSTFVEPQFRHLVVFTFIIEPTRSEQLDGFAQRISVLILSQLDSNFEKKKNGHQDDGCNLIEPPRTSDTIEACIAKIFGSKAVNAISARYDSCLYKYVSFNYSIGTDQCVPHSHCRKSENKQ